MRITSLFKTLALVSSLIVGGVVASPKLVAYAAYPLCNGGVSSVSLGQGGGRAYITVQASDQDPFNALTYSIHWSNGSTGGSGDYAGGVRLVSGSETSDSDTHLISTGSGLVNAHVQSDGVILSLINKPACNAGWPSAQNYIY